MEKDLRDATRDSLDRLGLVPLELLECKSAAFDARRGGLPRHYALDLLNDPRSGRALKFYLLLAEMSELIADQQFTAEQVFWSRYYWFVRFARVRQATEGPDAGLEQQAFQLLEHPYPDCQPDWSLAGEVEAAAERDAAVQLLRFQAGEK